MLDSIFLDCDGVVTDRKARVDSRVMFEAFRLAHSGKKVAFVTGRSLDWLSRNVVPAIERLNPSQEEKARFFFVGECGNRWLSFTSQGLAHGSDDSHTVPERIRSEVRQDIWRYPYLFFDESKESFISLEVEHQKVTSAQADRDAGRQLDEARDFFAAKYPDLNAIRTLYAVDITMPGVGKGAAARRALELMGRVSQALIVGDSPIDLEMGDELMGRGIAFEFYFVGEMAPQRSPFPVKRAPAFYAEGTLEVLRNVR